VRLLLKLPSSSLASALDAKEKVGADIGKCGRVGFKGGYDMR
jgi:hypothetical protein